MYTKRIQIFHYGPIEDLDIEIPFNGDSPKPVVLVGANGSGKSVLLSHIVNGLVMAKDVVFPETPEVDSKRAFKFRDPLYIRTGAEWSFARIDYQEGLFAGELTPLRLKRDYPETPLDLREKGLTAEWDQLGLDDRSRQIGNLNDSHQSRIERVISDNCVLYFPHNRFEEPAWLNQANLRSRANIIEAVRTIHYTSRRLIQYSPMHDNQDWLYSILFDLTVLKDSRAKHIYDIVLRLLQLLMSNQSGARFGIDRRDNRRISVDSNQGQLVPNIFQLSSGEASLLNLFLSILRDFDWTRATFTQADHVRGIVVVDEADLHLHAVHQHEILPSLIHMFPRIQFILTTHSPLFVLGMSRLFGDEGFALYRLPQGHQIKPETFTEFGDAYEAFKLTSQFSQDLSIAIRDSQRPILYVEGPTDKSYICRAADLLGQNSMLDQFQVLEGGGSGNLTNIWRGLNDLNDDVVSRKVVLLFDCEHPVMPETKRNRFKRKNQLKYNNHPIKTGIENLFSGSILGKAREHTGAFFSKITPAHPTLVNGCSQTVPETWEVTKAQKTSLCKWICENGTVEDFQYFEEVFSLLSEVLRSDEAE